MINSGEAGWDPPLPRKPGALLAVIALVLMIAATGFGVYELNDALGKKYEPKADGCMATDLGALSTLTTDAKPDIVRDETSASVCRIQFVRADGTPTAFGLVTLDYTGSRLASRLQLASHEGDEQWTTVAGLGEEAWQSFTPDECSFQVAVRDVNTVLRVELSGIPGEQLCSASNADAQKALTATAKATLARL
ncbi:hypothetical protein HH310_20025 [Actinoplanes sp. TBRC 11911]|uniref:hypothetical protein n=1 Tax=Actinoplanes sp. TBRC 11911 TaxID=2729386 RepID=UPI00145E2F55|nr:hypothetical protein [Actinoplanes sp. TBRC 11911]NMO53462.1 hypothetical protein [Actinoplanes sp. TBRC 11911]